MNINPITLNRIQNRPQLHLSMPLLVTLNHGDPR